MSHFFQTGVRCKLTLPLLNGFWRCQHDDDPAATMEITSSSSFPQCKIHSSFQGDKSGNWTSVEKLWRGEGRNHRSKSATSCLPNPFHFKMFSRSPFLRKEIRWCCWFANIAAAVAFFCGKTNDVLFFERNRPSECHFGIELKKATPHRISFISFHFLLRDEKSAFSSLPKRRQQKQRQQQQQRPPSPPPKQAI